ncbi:hypothetical protein KTO58_17040 [Chitinophaga pendula]|uniref:AsmA-like C-terminal region-containing protein n=1 Tax=Chitinophaga TaxID=79328 RepID=UPI000BB08274|nr:MULTISPECIES: AsmA-like C-terminal region-containing protein [Chitinophaga]ASZ11594.1 hypothetical protein CK934_11805 [Chitinophaga sp. MD30]UCJ05396.1 hypothetical protein KTO58_17040 [Chitinophaga pendula]
MLKKILKITGLVFLVLLLSAVAIPFFFKDKIISTVKTEINKALIAKVDFTDVDISLFRHFPRLSVGLEGLSVTGTGVFANDTLAAIRKLDVALNLMSVIKGGKMDIYQVDIQQPRIHAIVLADGAANWNITRPDTTSAPATDKPSTFALQLQRYKIEDATIRYEDRQSNMDLEIQGLNHQGKGDFTQDLFTLQTNTQAQGISFRYGAIPYFKDTKTSLDADIEINNKENTYTLNDSKLLLNNLEVAVKGLFKLVSDSSYYMDASFKTPSTNFKDLLSLVPAVYRKDFDKIKTSGTAAFNGFVKGTYSSAGWPAFGLELAIKNGFFQYPDLPKPVSNIQVAMHVSNPDGVPDHTTVDIPAAHLEMDHTPVDLRLLIKTPISDMYVDGAAKGKLDLSKVTQFVKLEAGTQLQGILDADINAKGYMSAVEKQQYDRFYAAGTMLVNNLLYHSKTYPDDIRVNQLQLTFNPKNVTVDQFNGQYLGTKFNAKGAVNNLLAYVLKNAPLDGHLAVQADAMNLNKWMGLSTTSNNASTSHIDTAAIPFAVPANLRFALQAAVGQIHYDKLDMSDITGALLIKDETVLLESVKGKALQGTMEVSGSYSTRQDRLHPDILLQYHVQQLDVQQTFTAFNTVQKLMPIGKFLSGKISSDLTVQGKLGKDMSPQLNTLSGDGNLLLIEGFLKKFAPVDQLANQLNISQLKDISLRDIKNYFAFENGRVKVNPFNVNINGIKMNIGGSHGFDQSLDYILQFALPRSIIGQQANNLVNQLSAEATKKGIPLNISDSIHLQVLMAGNIMKPSLKTDLRESTSKTINNLKDQAVSIVKNKVDTIKNTLKDSVRQVKNQAVASLKEELKRQLSGQKDTANTNNGKPLEQVGKQAEQTLKNTLNNLFKKKEQ